MSLHRLKPAFQSVLRPVARTMWIRGWTANQVTLLATVGSLLLGAALGALGPTTPALFLLLPPWLLLRMALNAIDGLLAREYAQATALGTYLNELSDPICDAALVLPFALVPPFSPAVVVAVALLASWTELAGVLGTAVGGSRRQDGPLGKSDRALVLGLLGVWVGLGEPLPGWAAAVMPLLAALLVVTLLRRVSRGVRDARGGRW